MGQPGDRRRARRRCGAARSLRRDRDPREGADAPARALPDQGVHRRAGRGIRDLGVVLRDLPVHDAVPPADPRALAAQGGARVPAGDRADLPRVGRERAAAREGLGRGADRRRARAGRDRTRPRAARDRDVVVEDAPPGADDRRPRHRPLQPGRQRPLRSAPCRRSRAASRPASTTRSARPASPSASRSSAH